MRFLVDTHAFLWYIADSPNLSEYAADLLENTEHQPVISTASLWEIAIKTSTGKLKVGSSLAVLVKDKITGLGFELTPIEPEHLDVLASLPFHHRDPFDRTLVAQCVYKKLPLLSRDAVLDS